MPRSIKSPRNSLSSAVLLATLVTVRLGAWSPDEINALGAPKASEVRRIINDSKNFLKNREPEMTADEYALYERISGMLTVQPEFALSLLENMAQGKDKMSPAFSFILGNAYYEAKRYDDAEKYFKQATTGLPEFQRAWSNLGLLYYAKNDFSQAALCISKAISLGDREPATYGILGYCLERQHNTIGAEAAYLQALAGDMGETDWAEGLLRLYMVGQQYTRAEGLVRQLLELRPAEPRYWANYATILLTTQRRLEALTALEVARGLHALDSESLLMLADLYAELKFNREALALYEQIAAESPQLGFERLSRFGRLLGAEGKYDEAARCFELAEKAAGPAQKNSLRLAKAEIATQQDRLEYAASELEAILAEEPFNGRALLRLGRVQILLKQYAKAGFTLSHATQVNETAYEALVELANLELLQEHFPKSLEYASSALRLEHSSVLEQFVARLSALVNPSL